MRKLVASALLFAAVVIPMFAAGSATAAPISGLFNTDASLAPDGTIDPHWLANGGSAYAYNHPAYLIDPSARFIAVDPTGGYSSATNTYTLSFDLTGFNPLTASLSGGFAGDNWADAYLNGILLASQPHLTIASNFQFLTPFAATGIDFVNGINTFSFVVTDTGPPSALMVVFQASDVLASTAAVPEPVTLSLFGAGLAGAAALRRRRKASIA